MRLVGLICQHMLLYVVHDTNKEYRSCVVISYQEEEWMISLDIDYFDNT